MLNNNSVKSKSSVLTLWHPNFHADKQWQGSDKKWQEKLKAGKSNTGQCLANTFASESRFPPESFNDGISACPYELFIPVYRKSTKKLPQGRSFNYTQWESFCFINLIIFTSFPQRHFISASSFIALRMNMFCSFAFCSQYFQSFYHKPIPQRLSTGLLSEW